MVFLMKDLRQRGLAVSGSDSEQVSASEGRSLGQVGDLRPSGETVGSSPGSMNRSSGVQVIRHQKESAFHYNHWNRIW